jgi:hypothetical protein
MDWVAVAQDKDRPVALVEAWTGLLWLRIRTDRRLF